jgi:hypothetical protein
MGWVEKEFPAMPNLTIPSIGQYPVLPGALRYTKGLFEILTTGVAGGVATEEAKHKQRHKEGDDEINHNFESQHDFKSPNSQLT